MHFPPKNPIIATCVFETMECKMAALSANRSVKWTRCDAGAML